MSKSQITVNASPVADRYGNEKIIEFSSPVGGGLISFTISADDRLDVHVYRQDMTVEVSAGEAGQPVRHGNLRADRALYQAAKAFVTDWESRNPAAPRNLWSGDAIRITGGQWAGFTGRIEHVHKIGSYKVRLDTTVPGIPGKLVTVQKREAAPAS